DHRRLRGPHPERTSMTLPRRRLLALPLLCSPLVALAACGATVDDDLGAEAGTVTVQRCGEEVEYAVPQRAVVYEGGSADKLFALGLTEHVHGYVMPPANPPVSE